MGKLTANYINQHQNTNRTYSQFGSLMVETILAKALAEIGSGSADTISFNLNFEITAFEPKDCLKICVKNTQGETWCIHQFEDEVFIQETK